jgi:hypothetical protein
MKSSTLTLAVAALAATVLSACGGGEERAPTAAETAAQSLDTQQVLALADTPSNTAQPLPVNDGLLVLDDTSETSLPINIDAM